VDALHIDAFDGVRKAKRIGDASVKLTAWPIGTLKSTGRGRGSELRKVLFGAPTRFWNPRLIPEE
jgi:hypothetical protein